MLDAILGIGASFDWISPFSKLVDRLISGPRHTFHIPYKRSPWSGREIQHALRKNKIKVGIGMVVGDTILLDVRLKQARYAQSLLERWGIPIDNPLPTQVKKRQRYVSAASYQCKHCGTRYRRWRSKCSQCGAPIGE